MLICLWVFGLSVVCILGFVFGLMFVWFDRFATLRVLFVLRFDCNSVWGLIFAGFEMFLCICTMLLIALISTLICFIYY